MNISRKLVEFNKIFNELKEKIKERDLKIEQLEEEKGLKDKELKRLSKEIEKVKEENEEFKKIEISTPQRKIKLRENE